MLQKYFLSFCQSESCGKCPPAGGHLPDATDTREDHFGKGEDGDIEELEKIGKLIKEGALCGLGNSARTRCLQR